MNEQLEERLRVLEAEFEAGKKMLSDLEAREAAVRASLLRISGAIQVLREFLPQEQASPEDAPPAESVPSTAADYVPA